MYGYGNSMFLATHAILARPSGGIDPDAQAFITAASITDPTQQAAINQLVVDLKGYNIWTKFKAIYPIVGGTAAQHKWNLKDPRDLDAAYRLVFSNGWTHSSTGMTPTNAYAQTNFATTNLNVDSNHLSYYSRTQNSSTNSISIGNDYGSGDQLYMSLYYSAVSLKFFLTGNFGSNDRASVNISNTLGFHIGTQTAINLRKLYFAGNLVATNTNSRSITRNANGIYLGALNNAGTAVLFSPHQCAFASIGDGLTDTEASNFYTAVQAYQTTLSRNI